MKKTNTRFRKIQLLTIFAFAVCIFANAQYENPKPAIVTEYIGTFEYRKTKDGSISGKETFHITVHPDGSRTVNARNELFNYGIQRHVTNHVDKNFRPLETTAVYWVLGEWRGTGMFITTGNELKAYVNTPDGFITQEIKVPDNFSIVPHPISTNAWHAWYYDKEKGGKQNATWYNPDAASQSAGSILGKLEYNELEYIGEEELTVPAGTFIVDHFRVGSVDYYTTGPDKIMVRFLWSDAGNDYVLKTFEKIEREPWVPTEEQKKKK